MKTFESEDKRVWQKGPPPGPQALKIDVGSNRVNLRSKFLTLIIFSETANLISDTDFDTLVQ